MAKRQVRNIKIDTEAIVKQALETVATKTLDTDKARARLVFYGHTNPEQSLIEKLAYEMAVLAELGHLTGANVSGQVGKWDMSNETTIHAAFNSYLNRRVAGMRSRWNG